MADNATGLPDSRLAGGSGNQRDIQAAIGARTPLPPGDAYSTAFPSGRVNEYHRARGRGGSRVLCPFGDIIKIPDSDPVQYGISGGWVSCGNRNYDVQPFPIPLAGSGKIRLWLQLTDIELVTDDDVETVLSGIITSTEDPTWESAAWSAETNYPNNTNPTTPTGTATLIIPIGVLTYGVGSRSFLPVACGPRWAWACEGIVSVYPGEPPIPAP